MALDLDPVIDRAVWTAADFSTVESYALVLTEAERREVESTVAALAALGTAYAQTVRADFLFPILGRRLAVAAEEVKSGRGFVLIRGLPIHADKDRIRLAAWGVGCWFGAAVSQNSRGEVLCDVMDVTAATTSTRGYNSSREQALHTDLAADIMTLTCIQPAREGGDSRIASAVTVFNAMARERPDLLRVLGEGFYMHRLGEERLDDPPITDYRVPFLVKHQGMVSGRGGRISATAAAKVRDEPLTDLQIEALNLHEAIADRPDYSLAFRLAPGDCLVANNLATLHARSTFVNFSEPQRHRHLLRLWLEAPPGFRSVPPTMNYFNRGRPGIPKSEGRVAHFDDMSGLLADIEKARVPTP